jgi:DNA repair exonuclease SbcCD nuclease subunit
VKIVFTADLHLHPWRLCSRDGGHDRLLDGLSVLRQSLDLARELRAAWVFCGDMKVPKNQWPQSALTGALEIFRKYDDVKKIMVPGNHDARGEGGTGLAPFRDVAEVVERASVVELGDWDNRVGISSTLPRIVCSPWDSELATVRALLEENPGAPLVAHGFLQGCLLGPEDARLAKGTPAADYGDFPVAFFGDVHKGQWRLPAIPPRPPEWFAYVEGTKIRAAGSWNGEIYYAGSPYQQNWGERNDPPKGALIVDFKTGEVRLHRLKAPRYRHLELDQWGLEQFVKTPVDESVGLLSKESFVRVIYTGKPCDALDQVREMGELFRSFQLIARRPSAELVARRADVHAGMATADLLKSYVAARPPESDPERTLKAGVKLVGGES